MSAITPLWSDNYASSISKDTAKRVPTRGHRQARADAAGQAAVDDVEPRGLGDAERAASAANYSLTREESYHSQGASVYKIYKANRIIFDSTAYGWWWCATLNKTSNNIHIFENTSGPNKQVALLHFDSLEEAEKIFSRLFKCP